MIFRRAMNRFSDLISEPAREMARFLPVMPSWQAEPETGGGLIRLDSNENPFGPSPRALEAMRVAVASVHAYPQDDCGVLRRKLASHHRLAAEQILVTAGSTAMLSLLCRALLGPGMNAVTSERTFVVYGMAVHAAGARLLQAPMRADRFDPQAILDVIEPNTRLVLVANPNNPTGTMLNAAEVEEVVAQVPEHVLVVLDEAYYEFAAHFAAIRGVTNSQSVDYVARGVNVVVLRSFSKAHGLAGLRIGYGLGPADLLGYCARLRDTYSVPSVAQAAALAAMEDHEHVARTAASNAEQAEKMRQELIRIGYEVPETWANFLYCRIGRDAEDFARRLRKEGVSVRPLGIWGAADCARVSIGTPEQNQRFLEAVRKVGKGFA
jgi:histidinol-phosphate aminotransferase